MTCTGRHTEREMVAGMAAGKLEHRRKCNTARTQYRHSHFRSTLQHRLSLRDFSRHRRTNSIMKEILVNTSSAEESTYEGIIVF